MKIFIEESGRETFGFEDRVFGDRKRRITGNTHSSHEAIHHSTFVVCGRTKLCEHLNEHTRHNRQT